MSGRTGKGVDEFVEYLISQLPEGPEYFPDDMITDVPEPFQVAELVREQLLRRFSEELPYSIAQRIDLRPQGAVQHPAAEVVGDRRASIDELARSE